MKKKTFTPEQIEAIKKKEKCNVVHIKIFLDEAKKDSYECILKDPMDMPDLSFASAYLSKSDSIKSGEFLIDSLWLDGDDDFKLKENSTNCVNPRVRLAAIPPANKIFKFADYEMVKI